MRLPTTRLLVFRIQYDTIQQILGEGMKGRGEPGFQGGGPRIPRGGKQGALRWLIITALPGH
ncbi:MAG: hypothetical protein LBG24_12410 [Treponema sp.]|nr:hypothetical protein [Treponema sp.]